MRLARPLFAVTFAFLVMSRVVACGPDQTSREMAALASAQRSASKTCADAGAPTGFDGATLARTAAATLRRAHMSPQPWDTAPPSEPVTFCYPIQATQDPGVYLDASGRHSAAPAGSQF